MPQAAVLVLSCSALWIVPSGVVSQPAGDGAPKRAAVTLSEQVELARLVDLAAQRLKVNIEYDATQLKGSTTLRLGAGVTDDELWNLMNRLLAGRGFTTVRAGGAERDDVLSVVRIETAAALARVDDGARLPEPRAGFVAATWTLKNRSAREKEFIEGVRQLLSKQGVGGGGPGSAGTAGVTALSDNTLVLTDLASRVEQAIRFIEAMDTEGERVEPVEVGVSHLTATQLAALATQHMARRDAISGGKTPGEVVASPDERTVTIIAPRSRHELWRNLLVSLDKREAVSTVTYTVRYFDLKEVARLIEQAAQPSTVDSDSRWRVVDDPLTSSLLVTATSAEHEQVAAVVDRLNAAPVEGRRPPRVFKIRNRSVTEVLGVLQGLVTSGALEGGGSNTTTPPTPDAASSREGLVAPSTSAATDRVPTRAGAAAAGGGAGRPRGSGTSQTGDHAALTESLVLTADEGTSSIIAIGEPMLLTQVEALIKQLDVRQPQVMVQALVVTLNESQSRDLGIELEGQINLSADSVLRLSSLFGLSAAGAGVGQRTASGGGTGLLLSPGEFAAVIRALESVTRGRSVSRPQVLVSNNQQATFNSVVEQPYQSTSTANNVTSSTLGGSSTAGTVITVRPQIADGDHLLLEYSVELSAFVGDASSEFVPPPRQTNNVSSSATLPDGFTIAVGGLELTTEGESVQQIPLLGSIPVLGEAFKNRSRSSSRNRFFVFLRAEVMRHSNFEDLKYLSSVQAGEASVNDGLPELEPRIIR